MTEITTKEFQNEVLGSDVPVLVDFWAPWCGPCKMQAPILEQAEADLDGKGKIVKVNIDTEQELAMKYNVMSIPTLIVFQNGEVAKSKVGVSQKDEILDMLSL